MKTLLLGGRTHPGRRRTENQDALIARQLWSADKALLAVVDGVGGYTGGEKAAAIAKDSIEQYMQIPRGDTLTMLREAVVFANNRIVEERRKDQQVSEMCCVLTAVVADSTTKQIYYAHVGDTRFYRYRNNTLQKLTKDHSFVGIKEDAGDITEQEAMAHPHRNQILREVGSTPHRIDDEDFMDYGSEDFLPGDLLLLCSDGLTDMITAQQMMTVLAAGKSLTGKVNSLVTLANEMGGYDNITVVLLQHQLTAIPTEKELPIENRPALPVADEVAVTEALPTLAQKVEQKRSRKKNGLLLAGLVLLAAASLGWYLTPEKEPVVPKPLPVVYNALPADMLPDSNRTTSVEQSVHPAVPGPVNTDTLHNDTLRIIATWNLKDLEHYADSIGKVLIVMPAKNNQNRFAAVEITSRSAKPGDTLLIKNLRLKDFETGINVRVNVLLKTENLVFENIRYPFSYLFNQRTRITPALLTNTVKR